MVGRMMTVFVQKQIKYWNKFCGQDAEMMTFIMVVHTNYVVSYRVKTQ
jgi:hypothetical protein